MLNLPISSIPGLVLFDSARPKNEFNSQAQKVDENGVPQWRCRCVVRLEDANQSEFVDVTIASPVDPSTVVNPFARVAFDGLRVMTGQGHNGATWVSLFADSMRPAAKKGE